MKLLVVDDQVLFREGLVTMLNAQADITVVGEAGSMREAIEKAQETQPDLVLMDLFLPDGDGLETMKAILGQRPETKVVILTIDDSFDVLKLAFLYGAKGYLLKNMPISKIVVSLRAVERGEVALSRAMTSLILEEFTRIGSQTNFLQASLNGLTSREVDVFKQLGLGASNRQIAENLVIAENTVKIHVHNIYEKLRLNNRHEAMVFARRLGLVNSPEPENGAKLEA
jgi:two-component system NarL family response regulator